MLFERIFIELMKGFRKVVIDGFWFLNYRVVNNIFFFFMCKW